MATIKWRGKGIVAKMALAAQAGVDRTMAACVDDAKANHPEYPPASDPYTRYANRTGHATGSIQILAGEGGEAGAALVDGKVVGHWGSTANYSLYLEIGTSVEGPTATDREIAGGGDMDAIPPPIGPLMAKRPTLRPAADKEYPFLGVRIGQFYRGEEMI